MPAAAGRWAGDSPLRECVALSLVLQKRPQEALLCLSAATPTLATGVPPPTLATGVLSAVALTMLGSDTRHSALDTRHLSLALSLRPEPGLAGAARARLWLLLARAWLDTNHPDAPLAAAELCLRCLNLAPSHRVQAECLACLLAALWGRRPDVGAAETAFLRAELGRCEGGGGEPLVHRWG